MSGSAERTGSSPRIIRATHFTGGQNSPRNRVCRGDPESVHLGMKTHSAAASRCIASAIARRGDDNTEDPYLTRTVWPHNAQVRRKAATVYLKSYEVRRPLFRRTIVMPRPARRAGQSVVPRLARRGRRFASGGAPTRERAGRTPLATDSCWRRASLHPIDCFRNSGPRYASAHARSCPGIHGPVRERRRGVYEAGSRLVLRPSPPSYTRSLPNAQAKLQRNI